MQTLWGKVMKTSQKLRMFTYKMKLVHIIFAILFCGSIPRAWRSLQALHTENAASDLRQRLITNALETFHWFVKWKSVCYRLQLQINECKLVAPPTRLDSQLIKCDAARWEDEGEKQGRDRKGRVGGVKEKKGGRRGRMQSGERKHFSLIKSNVLLVRVIMFREGWYGGFDTAGQRFSRVSQ